jgi:hypothetical protein
VSFSLRKIEFFLDEYDFCINRFWKAVVNATKMGKLWLKMG